MRRLNKTLALLTYNPGRAKQEKQSKKRKTDPCTFNPVCFWVFFLKDSVSLRKLWCLCQRASDVHSVLLESCLTQSNLGSVVKWCKWHKILGGGGCKMLPSCVCGYIQCSERNTECGNRTYERQVRTTVCHGQRYLGSVYWSKSEHYFILGIS